MPHVMCKILNKSILSNHYKSTESASIQTHDGHWAGSHQVASWGRQPGEFCLSVCVPDQRYADRPLGKKVNEIFWHIGMQKSDQLLTHSHKQDTDYCSHRICPFVLYSIQTPAKIGRKFDILADIQTSDATNVQILTKINQNILTFFIHTW